MKTANRKDRRAAGERNEPFVATRPANEIELVMIEKSALQILTAVGKAVVQFRQQSPEHKDSVDAMQVEVAVTLAENALNANSGPRFVK